MYPEVFADFAKFERDYSDLAVLPTRAFFYGLKPGEEISVDIEAGKTLFIQLINIGAVDKDGRRTVTFELNGMTREASIVDKTVQAKAKARPKADPADPLQVGAPIPGLITALAVERRHQGQQRRQTPDPGSHENANHHLRPRRRRRRIHLRPSRRNRRQQRPVDQIAEVNNLNALPFGYCPILILTRRVAEMHKSRRHLGIRTEKQ